MRHQPDEYRVIFWDFDGVIKDSVGVKTTAFQRLFADFGTKVQDQVKAHHEAHGGISRFEKIPHYFRTYVGRELGPQEVAQWCEAFGNLVAREVVGAPWVPGVLEYLRKNFRRQDFFIVTGTPQDEILQIVQKLEIDTFFHGIWGTPASKREVVARVLQDGSFCLAECLLVGDSLTDYHAARDNGIDFLLRETEENQAIFSTIDCARCPDFSRFFQVDSDWPVCLQGGDND